MKRNIILGLLILLFVISVSFCGLGFYYNTNKIFDDNDIKDDISDKNDDTDGKTIIINTPDVSDKDPSDVPNADDDDSNNDDNDNDIDNDHSDDDSDDPYFYYFSYITEEVDKELWNEKYKNLKEMSLDEYEKTYDIFKNLSDLSSTIEAMQKEYYDGGYDDGEFEDDYNRFPILRLKYENNTLTYSYEKNEQIIKNVKYVKANYTGCSSETMVAAAFTDDGIWFFNTDSEIYGEKFVKLDKKYIDLKDLPVSGDSCGTINYYLAKNENGDYYNVETFKKFYTDVYLIDYDEFNVRVDGRIYLANKKTDFVMKRGLYTCFGQLAYFISPDNYLYTRSLKKRYDYKVKKILYKQDQWSKIPVILFENGAYFENGDDCELYIGE